MSRQTRALKLPLILTLLLGAGLALVASALPWGTLSNAPGVAEPLVVTGAQADGGLVALALAALAAAAALAIAGTVLRVVLGTLSVVLGACLALSLVTTAGDQTSWFADAVRTSTGLSGQQAVAEIVAAGSVTVTPLPGILVAIGAGLVILAGLAVVVTGRSWPRGGRRYSSSRLEREDRQDPENSADARVDQWDALSEGEDPTDETPDVSGSDQAPSPR